MEGAHDGEYPVQLEAAVERREEAGRSKSIDLSLTKFNAAAILNSVAGVIQVLVDDILKLLKL